MAGAIFILYMGVTFIIRFFQWILACFVAGKPDRHTGTYQSSGEQPFVSIHMAISNEPPRLVIQTLRSLLNIAYERYEIVVVDNNTEKEETWRPVEQFCRSQKRITFVHIPELGGYKAGALNRCIRNMDERAEFIMVADADFMVHPDVLHICTGYARQERVDLLQFPLSYRNGNRYSGLVMDYNSYFRIFMHTANRLNCVLSTGTLSFVRYGALKEAGGWKSDTITEDTELGVRFILAGYKMLFVNREIGSSLLPPDHFSFEKQRRRWVTGNVQVLKKHITRLIGSPVLSARQKAVVFLQLTAWIDFKIMALILFGFLQLAGIGTGLIVAFWIYFVLMILMKAVIYRSVSRGAGLMKNIDTLVISQSVAFSTGLSWLRAFTPAELSFDITDKRVQ